MDQKLTKIGFVMLGTKDLAKAVAFYRDQLGMTVQQQIPGFAFLDGGGITLALSEPLAKAREHLVGATEVVFPVSGVREACAALRARGVVFVKEPQEVSPAKWAANFTDPDGHSLSIFGSE
jgi:catechol 2,3-dioxygenase-like lactoylglutathione lyase family enzyme